MRTVWSLAAIALLGAIVAVVGAGSHRAYGWLGVAACLLMVAMASTFVRAWRGFGGLTAFAVPWAALTVVFAVSGPGGSAPLILSDARGLAWVFGGSILIGAVASLPKSLLGDEKGAAS